MGMRDDLTVSCDLCVVGNGRMTVLGSDVVWVCSGCARYVQRVWRMKRIGKAAA